MDNNTLRRDFVNLNRNYLFLVRQLSADPRAATLTGIPDAVIDQIRNMSLEEIEHMAESMAIPCFRLNSTDFEVVAKLDKQNRRAFLANTALAQE